MSTPRARFRRNSSAIRAYLARDVALRQAVKRHADDLAARVASAPAGVYDRMPTPIVTTSATAGARRDRAGATVLVPAPPTGAVRYPDVKSRYRSVVGVVGSVTHG
ncbi:hypothetical protein [Pseudonocardia sp. N23]|uniref:hypothetical protein n=1 Tax=Pseudonocardia sp. N23 TaxID=1987376 RepID=UPI000BFD352E|nr:hypothetical protein [Pseudonocardia sp. N23]GAY12038.1 hypothetical protein TOK_0428 [Pseudonocardia sp. N23]